jgi:prepilin-type N-terminal cleavage/methylation domain-containing protein
MKMNGKRCCDDRFSAGDAAARGMTLMEVMLALALTGILMSSIAVALNLFWRYRTLSQENASTSGIRRGIYEDIAVDLRAVLRPTAPLKRPVLKRSNSGESSLQDFSGGNELVLDYTEMLTIPDQAIADHPVSFLGEAGWFAVLSRATSYRFPNTQAYGSEFGHIVWSNGQALRGVFSLHDEQSVSLSLSQAQNAPSLIRRIVPFTSNASSSDPEITELLISSRVRSISFRYLDGAKWVTRWSSEELQGLPVAVECRLEWTDGSPMDVFVINLPAAEQ